MAKEMTPQEQEMYQLFHDEESAKPMKFLMWETSFMDNDSIRELRDTHGWDFVAYYTALMCVLAKRKNHVYPVETEAQRFYLAHDLWISETTLSDVLDVLADSELINSEMYREHKKVMSNRVNKEAQRQGDSGAAKRLGAWKRHNR